MPVIAAVITAVATIAAAVIAAVASGDDSSSDSLRAGPATTSVTSSASTTEPTASADGPGPPVQTLPATDPTTPDSVPRVVVTPYMAAAGEKVTIEISGFAPDERICISFRDSGSVEKDLRDVITDADGRAAAEVKVPAEVGSGDETPVFRVWSVDDVDSNNTADTPFTYTE
ncbi:hypothetical protein [Streptomyces sp. NBC_00059]|uniref:hypothetical protein n=1 Tax=Streptomyces sp. NBC_00059 TaxID=2975635 RepID=UPI0022547CE9|nr:hypothetical protein [Streptomyces sp. NBC_00059]MCX5410927.1 hypothetical protein [Streptomyces sp. NBC_00059]